MYYANVAQPGVTVTAAKNALALSTLEIFESHPSTNLWETPKLKQDKQ